MPDGARVKPCPPLWLVVPSETASQYAVGVVRDVPNLLTVLRLFAVPVMVLCLVWDGGEEASLRWLAFAVFIAAAFTDWLDGYLARRWDVVSAFGKLADPLADKALVLGGLAVLAYREEIPWWPLIVIAVREAGVTLGRLAVAKDVVIPASLGGKAKTALQVIALFLLLMPVAVTWVDTAGWWILVASVVVAVATGIDYGWRIARILRTPAVKPDAADARVASAEGSGHGL